jgi:predicted transcriptional regulator
MTLQRETKKSDEVRAPAVPRGTAIIVTRYREDVAKVALVNPEDLAMLEESHDLLDALEAPAHTSPSKISRKALRLEDRPDADARVEDADRIAEILEL